MKKLYGIIRVLFLGLLLVNPLCASGEEPKQAQSSFASDAALKSYLVKTGFGAFTFYSDNSFTYSQRVIGDTIVGRGSYAVEKGLLVLKSYTGSGDEKPVYGGDYYDRMQIPGTYRVEPEKTSIFYQGALVNAADGKCYWSNKWAPPYVRVNYEGAECIRYPWRNEGVDNEYIVILENLRLRKQPSTASKTVSVYGYGGNSGDVGYLFERRSIEFAGTVSTIRAKSVKEDTIDGITAPWYLIVAYGITEGDDPGTEWAWVFGGYVKEIKASDVDKYEQMYKTTLEKAVIAAGGQLHAADD